MRPIGQLETEEQARTFADYLFVRELDVQVEASPSGGWIIWVVDEERVDEGQALLSRFRSMPDAEEFYQASGVAEERRRGERKAAREIEKKLKRPGAFPWVMPGGGWTMILLALSVIAALLTQVGAQESWTRALQISEYSLRPAHSLHLWSSLVEVRQGQIWRLWTPIFLHFGIWHLIFNLFWLRDFGAILERKTGSWRFICGVAFMALISNLAQFMVTGPHFGGMSGVVYGLFGYLWMRGRQDSSYAGLLAPMTSTLLFVYLALGFFGILGPTANAAHVSGLAAGAAMGWVAAWRQS
jgi:rhomboid protease GlpG